MATAAVAAYGTTFAMDDGSLNFTSIAELRDIVPGELALDTKEVTTHASTDAAKEYISTLVDLGTATFTINYLTGNATHNATAGLLYVLYGRLQRSFKCTYPSTAVWQFKGFVTRFRPNAPVNGELSANVTIKFTGAKTTLT